MDLKEEFDLRRKLMFITRNLRIYDKISVIFLICDKPYAGLKLMEILLATDSEALQNKAFYAWAKKQMIFNRTDWQGRFVDILSVIQNFRLVKYLDCRQEESTSSSNQSANDIRIALYKMCEELDFFQTSQLITTIDSSHHLTSKDFMNRYLEYKLFEWSIKNVISFVKDKKINLNPILENLSSDSLKATLRGSVENFEFQLLRDMKSIHSLNCLPDCYDVIDKYNLGMCVIINEKKFPGTEFSPRWGSNKDMARLEEVFTAFGFRIEIHSDVTHKELFDLLHGYAKAVSLNDSFFVLILLSHGSENVIYTSDAVPVSMDAIEMCFQGGNCPNLIGKPKIFIVQSCQGQNWQKQVAHNLQSNLDESEIATDGPPTVTAIDGSKLIGPQKGDSIIAWSTVQGYASFRDKHNGSWYIEELCKELWKFSQVTDLVDILTLVNNNLRSKIYDNQIMVPSLLSSLRYKIQFPHVKENFLRGREMLVKRLFFEAYFLEFLNNSDLSHFDILKLKLKS